VNAKLITK